MADDSTVTAFKGPGPFTLPDLTEITVSMTEDKMALIQGMLPEAGGEIQRFVHIPLSLKEAMRLKALLEHFQSVYDLPEPKGTVSERTFQ